MVTYLVSCALVYTITYLFTKSDFLDKMHLLGWLEPMIWWSFFLTVTVFTMLCLTVIARQQWIEKEKLSYPLVHLPLEIDTNGCWSKGGWLLSKSIALARVFPDLLFGLTQQLCLPVPTPSQSTDEIRSAYSFYQPSFQCNGKRTGSVESLRDWTSVPNSTRLPLLLLVFVPCLESAISLWGNN